MKPGQFVIEIAGMAVHVMRKPIKNMYLRVDGQTGQARITAPVGISVEKILAFAQKHEAWLAARALQIKERGQPEPQIIPESQKIWGSPHDVELRPGLDFYDIRLDRGKLLISTPERPGYEQWLALLDVLLRELVYAEAPALIAAWSKKLKLAEPSFGVRRMKKRWGTCYPARKRIILNSALAAYPKGCLEAVIVHELLHFREPNHGPAFKALLDQALPGWRQMDALLQ